MNTIVMQRQHLWQRQGGVRAVIRYAIYVTLFAVFGIQCKYLFVSLNHFSTYIRYKQDLFLINKISLNRFS